MTTTAKLPDKIGRWFAFKVSKHAITREFEYQELDIKECSESIENDLYSFFIERLDKKSVNAAISSGLCIDDPNASIGGTFLDPNLEFIYLGVQHCHEYNFFWDCASAEQAEDYWKHESAFVSII